MKGRAERRALSGLHPVINQASSILRDSNASTSKPPNKARKLQKARIVLKNLWHSERRKLRLESGAKRRVLLGLRIRKSCNRGLKIKRDHLERTVATAPRLLDKSVHNFKDSTIQEDGSIHIRHGKETPVREGDFLFRATPLDRYLEEKDPSRRKRIWNQVKLTIVPESLPEITLHYLHTSIIPKVYNLLALLDVR